MRAAGAWRLLVWSAGLSARLFMRCSSCFSWSLFCSQSDQEIRSATTIVSSRKPYHFKVYTANSSRHRFRYRNLLLFLLRRVPLGQLNVDVRLLAVFGRCKSGPFAEHLCKMLHVLITDPLGNSGQLQLRIQQQQLGLLQPE